MNESHIHVSLDIETTGLIPGCGIWQIGATVIEDQLGTTSFNGVINPVDCDIAGLNSDPATMKWQRERNAENFDRATQVESDGHAGQEDLLRRFSSFLHSLGPKEKIFIWVKGANFDIAILEHAYRYFGIPIPWKYNHAFCMRALEYLFPDQKVSAGPGAHDALIDAIAQAKTVQRVMKYVKESS